MIAIIALLIGILLPVLGAARDSARQAQSLSQLRQIGIAITAYADQYEGFLPGSTHPLNSFPPVPGASLAPWYERLDPFLADSLETRICPLDPKADEARDLDGTSFVINDYLVQVPGTPDVPAPPTIEQITNASEVVTLLPIGDKRGRDNDHIDAPAWEFYFTADLRWGQMIEDIQFNRFRRGPSGPDALNGSAPYLYVDGHAADVPAIEARAWAEDPLTISPQAQR